ncbi:MAG TPA: hypothetical protein VF199_05390 [Bacillales bacterium]
MNRLGRFWLFPAAALITSVIIRSYSLLLLAVIWIVVLFIGMLILRVLERRSARNNQKMRNK